jgi:hypothetical protein
MYIQESTGKILQNQIEIRKLFPNTSFKSPIATSVLKAFGIYPLEYAPEPAYNLATQKLVPKYTPEKLTRQVAEITEEYMLLGYDIVNLTPEEIAQTTIRASIEKQNRINNAKYERNRLLTQSDWTQLPDVSLTTEQKEQWATYRQQLRDLTDQQEFPTNIIWPQAPQ